MPCAAGAAEALTALRTSSSLKTLQEQTIKGGFRCDAGFFDSEASGRGAKQKGAISRYSELPWLSAGPIWNESKQPVTARLLA